MGEGFGAPSPITTSSPSCEWGLRWSQPQFYGGWSQGLGKAECGVWHLATQVVAYQNDPIAYIGTARIHCSSPGYVPGLFRRSRDWRSSYFLNRSQSCVLNGELLLSAKSAKDRGAYDADQLHIHGGGPHPVLCHPRPPADGHEPQIAMGRICMLRSFKCSEYARQIRIASGLVRLAS